MNKQTINTLIKGLSSLLTVNKAGHTLTAGLGVVMTVLSAYMLVPGTTSTSADSVTSCANQTSPACLITIIVSSVITFFHSVAHLVTGKSAVPVSPPSVPTVVVEPTHPTQPTQPIQINPQRPGGPVPPSI